MFFDPQLLHQMYRELAALSPEPIFDDIELLTVELTTLINPVIKRMDNQLSELTMSHRVSFTFNDKPPSEQMDNEQRSISLNEEVNLVYIYSDSLRIDYFPL